MYTNGLKIAQGTKILWEGAIREVSFELSYILGTDDSWADAEERGLAITQQMIRDWLEEMSAQGRIESIDPLTFVQTFEYGMPKETLYKVPDLIWKKSVLFKDERELAKEAPPEQKRLPEDCLVHKAVRLTFDATGSQERAVRILRAYEEPYTFVRQSNENWTCMHKERTYQLYINLEKSVGFCTCMDFQQRGLKEGMPCKHIYAYVLQDGKMKVKEVVK